MSNLTSGNMLVYLALASVVTGNVLGNFFMKLGANSEAYGYRLFGLFGWPTLLGIACFGSSVLLYAWSLRHVDLHVAQAVMALQFAGAIILAAFFFKEAIGLNQWIGLGLILTGLAVCSR